MKAVLLAALSRILRGPAAVNLLRSLNIDPRRFWLLTDLFDRLAGRRELKHLGAGMDLKFAEILCFAATSLAGAVISFTSTMAPATYLTIFIVWTAIMLSAALVPEIADTLINPVESLVLAHYPINGTTYTGAKLARLVTAAFGTLCLLWLLPELPAEQPELFWQPVCGRFRRTF